MICADCHGRGVKQDLDENGRPGETWSPCSVCLGHGHIHCCEGDQEQPEGPDASRAPKMP